VSKATRGWLDFGPRAGIHSWLAADFTAVVIASFLAILYVWVDEPGPTDAGRRSLGGWLVALFGPRWARVGGVALFSALSLVLLRALIAYYRWLSGPRRERRLHRQAAKAAR
jgi:hypothetical protein